MSTPRFRIRSLMIAVAVAAVVMAVEAFLLRAARCSGGNTLVLLCSANFMAVWGGLFASTILWSLVYVTRRRCGPLMPLPRMTTRRLMLAVAAVGVSLSGAQLAYVAWMRHAAARNAAAAAESYRTGVIQNTKRLMAFARSEAERQSLEQFLEREIAFADHLSTLAKKYERGARYPWRSLPPDPLWP